MDYERAGALVISGLASAARDVLEGITRRKLNPVCRRSRLLGAIGILLTLPHLVTLYSQF